MMTDASNNGWRSVPNLRSTDAQDLEGFPWEFELEKPKFKSKAVYRKWCLNKDTEHIFFTAFEGVNRDQRIDKDNPQHIMRGWVADYDADVSREDLLAKIKKIPADLKPFAISTTFSGGARAVWLFEKPVWVDDVEVADKFIKKFHQLVRAPRLAPGFDAASLIPSMVWELGTDWETIPDAMRTTSQTTNQLYIEAVAQTKEIKSTFEEVPLNEIQEEIEKQYPNRLNGAELELGARIPLFWVPECGDGKENDLSAIVAEWGCYSFSSRAEKGRMFWDELLGPTFTRQFKEKRTSMAMADIHYDGSHYWRPGGNGSWRPSSRDDMSLHLKVAAGLSSVKDKKASSSELEDVLYNIQELHRVDATAPFPYTTENFVTFNGEDYLNTSQTSYMPPAATGDPKDFPWMFEFIHNFLGQHEDDKIHPKYYLIAELQRFYRSLVTNTPTSGHANIIVGGADKGKSLFTTCIMRLISGAATDAGEFLVTGKSFNKALAESNTWFIDDNKSTTSISQHKNFSESLKKHVATPEVQYQPKFKDSRPLPWYGRIFITCNEDSDSITIVPDMDITIRDKVNLFRVNPDWKATFYPNGEMLAMIQSELPHFLRWILDFELPEGIETPKSPRFGLEVYHHPDLVDTARESSSQFRLSEIIELWIDAQSRQANAPDMWEGTSTELLLRLADKEEELAPLVRSYTPVSFGRQLQGLDKLGECEYLELDSSGAKAIWRIQIPDAPLP